jgi:hypothetical protein
LARGCADGDLTAFEGDGQFGGFPLNPGCPLDTVDSNIQRVLIVFRGEERQDSEGVLNAAC